MKDSIKKIKVLMVGTDRSTKGGMWTVANNYISNIEYNDKVELKYIPTFITGSVPKKLLFSFFSIIRVFFYFVFHRPQLLHVHMSERSSVYRKGITIKIAQLFNSKVVIHMHGAEFQDWYEELNDKKKAKVKKILNRADKVLILGEYWKAFVSSLVPEKKVVVLYNAVPHHANVYNGNASTILFLGVVGQRKGAFDLVKAFSEIIPEIPQNIHLDFYGPDFEKKIEQEIDNSGFSGRIRYMGWLGSDKKESVFKDTLCNVLPSYNEGLPMTILETMSVGIPNISTNVAAIPEVIDDENGILVHPGNIEEIKAALLKLIMNREERIGKSRKSYEIIENGFIISKNIANTIRIYSEVLSIEK